MINTPFRIGCLELPHRLIQAPLAGISCAPFRALFSHYQAPAYAVTEMISAHSMLQHITLNRRYLSHSKQEGRWCIQLSGENPDIMYQAVALAENYQPDLIDLNCGCPKPKIRTKGSGSALLESPKKLERIVSAMRKATVLPLTVKVRTAGHTNDKRYLEAAKIIEASGADAIIVHARHYTEDYTVPARYEQIQSIVEMLNIPVIANGDVYDLKSMQACFERSGATAVMIGRGSIGKPWLFESLLHKNTKTPLISEVIKCFQMHIMQLARLEGNEIIALLQARRLLKWYFPGINKATRDACYAAESITALCSSVAQFFTKFTPN